MSDCKVRPVCVCVLVGVPGLRATDQSVMFARRLLPTARRCPDQPRASGLIVNLHRFVDSGFSPRAVWTLSLTTFAHVALPLLDVS